MRTEENGRDLLERIGGEACSSPTVYYAGGYNNPDDTGKIRGCTQGAKDHLVGRFESNRTKAQGSFDIRRSGSGWKGTWSTDAGDGGNWSGDFKKHFGGDRPEVKVIKRIEDVDEFRIFFGLDDPNQSSWKPWINGVCADVAAAVGGYSGATWKAKIPRETALGKHSSNLLFPGGDLFELLSRSDPPASLRPGNVYSVVTRRFEKKLRNKILKSSGGLHPADVTRMALEVTGGSYPLAVLTAHNFLKGVTVVGREVVNEAASATRKVFPRKIGGWRKTLKRQSDVVAKLRSLRSNPRKAGDKMGPWYHTFAVLTAGSLITPAAATGIVLAEHATKWFKAFKNEGGFNKEKYRIDLCMARTAGDARIEAVSRVDKNKPPVQR